MMLPLLFAYLAPGPQPGLLFVHHTFGRFLAGCGPHFLRDTTLLGRAFVGSGMPPPVTGQQVGRQPTRLAAMLKLSGRGACASGLPSSTAWC